MKTIFNIARWEFITRFKTRSFLFATFVLPVIFSILITLPVYLLTFDEKITTKLIGIINLSDENITQKLQSYLNKNYRLQGGSPEYIILPVSVENDPIYKQAKNEFHEVSSRLDSITNVYTDIKNLRTRYYQNRSLKNKEYLLQKTYEEMITVREEKDLVEIEFENYSTRLDSIYNRQARLSADSLLLKSILNAYLVLPENAFDRGLIEYHSLEPGNLLESERMQKLLNEVIIQTRILKADIEPQQAAAWLKPIKLRKYQLREQGPTEWDFYIEFYGSVIGIVLLFMAIFTSGGFLFSSVLQEKTNRVIELLLSYASSLQIMAGKIFGLGFLGLIQVLIWISIAALFVLFNLFEASRISYLSVENGLYFLLYFSLGYLLYAAIFVAIGAIFSSEQDAQQVNIVLRTFAILPVLLVFLFLKRPDSEIIQILTYIPLLTPYFMIMKISQFGASMISEIYATSIILLVSIIGMVFVAAKIFRMGILLYGKKLSFREILLLLRSG